MQNSSAYKNKLFVVALSGGVDSSVAAKLLLEKGADVVGATLLVKHPDKNFSASQKCSSDTDVEMVRSVGAKLGIETNFIEAFPDFEEQILKNAWMEYSSGRTPNPCVMCNRIIKFGKLLNFADSIGAAGVVTGHYAQIGMEADGTYAIRRGEDVTKDQSYFLHRLRKDDLARIHFPLGAMKKSEVRMLAESYGLATAKRPDSQDACFLSEGETFGETLRRLLGAQSRPGSFTYQGRIVGRHTGVHNYTIGQRKGLNVALGVPAYIKSINAKTGDIELVTDENFLDCRIFTVKNINFQQDVKFPLSCQVQIRYRTRPVDCLVEMFEKDGERLLRVTFSSPVRAVTPGQSAVFYDGTKLLGGGVIDEIF